MRSALQSLILAIVFFVCVAILQPQAADAAIVVGASTTATRGETKNISLAQTGTCNGSVPAAVGASIAADWNGSKTGNLSRNYTFNNVGTFTFTCIDSVDSSVGGSATITVNDCNPVTHYWNGTACAPNIPRLIICPSTASYAVGSTGNLSARYWSHQSSAPNCSTTGYTTVTNSTNWSSTAGGVFSVSNVVGSKGAYAAVFPGSATVSATYGVTAAPGLAITVTNTVPTAPVLVTAPASATVGTTVWFTVRSTDADGDNLQYQVDWDNNGTADATLPAVAIPQNNDFNFSRVWGSVGSYTFRVRAQDVNFGVSGWTSHTINITAAPTAPTVSSPTDSSISQTGATLGATVTSNGGSALTARGTCWGTVTNPSTNCVAQGSTAVSAFTHARTGMPSGTTIYYRGYATNAVGTSYSVSDSFVTIPANPNSPSAIAGSCGTGQVTVSWTGVTGATGYDLRYRVAPSGGWTTLTNVTNPRTVSGLTAGTSYDFQVLAKNATGNSGWSTSATTNAPATCVYPDLVAAPPTLSSGTLTRGVSTVTFTGSVENSGGVVAGAYTNGVFYIDANGDDIHEYTVPASAVTLTTNVGSSRTTTGSWSVPAGAPVGTNYRVSYFADNGNTVNEGPGDGPWINWSNWSAPFTVNDVAPGAPGQPGAVAGACGTGAVSVSWTAVGGATGYDLRYKLTSSGTWTSITDVTSAHNVTGLTANTSYDFQVRSKNSGGPSGWSATRTITSPNICPLPQPGAPTVTTSATCGGRINVTWPPVGGATGYDLQYKLSSAPGGWIFLGNVSSPQNLTLTPSTAYDFQLRTKNAGGDSSWSAYGSAPSSAACLTPTLSLPTHTSVTQTSATIGATLDNDGGSPIIANWRGMCLGTSPAPTSCTSIGGTALGAFTANRTGLTPGTTYYYRGYADNAVGRGYSPEDSFVTLANVPGAIAVTPQPCGTGQNFLDWPDAAGATSYSIYNADTNAWIGNSLGSNYMHNGTQSTTYRYYVRSNNSAGAQSANSAASAPATTLGPCPINGVCGPAARTYGFNESVFVGAFCSVGSANPAAPAFPAQGATTNWQCMGQFGGTNAACSATRDNPPPPEVTVGDCTIAVEGNTCTRSDVTWNLEAFAGPYNITNTTNGSTLANTASTSAAIAVGAGRRLTLNYGSNTINALTGALPGVVRASDTATASCDTGAGHFWHTGLAVCKASPQIQITSPIGGSLIRSGQTATINYQINANYDVSCTITGLNGGGPTTYNHTGAVGWVVAVPSSVTGSLEAAQIVRIECGVVGIPASYRSTEVRINVIPEQQET